MNNHQITITDSDVADSARIHRVLQQSVDHYPRLAALCFTLPAVPGDDTAVSQTRVQYFQADVYRRISDYATIRTTTGKPSPPTLLRWLWGSGSQMLLLFNLAVCHHPRHDASPEAGLQLMAALLNAAWDAVSSAGTLSDIIPFSAERTNPGAFDRQLAALRGTARQMASPVMTARSGPAVCIPVAKA